MVGELSVPQTCPLEEGKRNAAPQDGARFIEDGMREESSPPPEPRIPANGCQRASRLPEVKCPRPLLEAEPVRLAAAHHPLHSDGRYTTEGRLGDGVVQHVSHATPAASSPATKQGGQTTRVLLPIPRRHPC